MSCWRNGTRVGRSATWHYLGAVQRNKVGRLAPFVDLWQAVARVVEGEAIMRHCSAVNRRPVARRPGRPGFTAGRGRHDRAGGPGGCAPEEVPALVAGLREIGCRVEGLDDGGTSRRGERWRERRSIVWRDCATTLVSPSSRWACRAISSRPSPRARRWCASGLACSVLARNVAGCNNRGSWRRVGDGFVRAKSADVPRSEGHRR